MRLDPAAELAGYRLVAHENLDSTNAEALRMAFEHRCANDPVWIVAVRQTAGRGRRGNAWVSPAGNLHATLLLEDPASLPSDCPQLSFVAALAAHDAVVRCARALRDKLAIKWPNDLLCADAKIGGILIEGYRLHSPLVVAVGIGINCAHHPADSSFPASDLAAQGEPVAPGDLFFALSGAMLQRLGQWAGGAGFGAIRSDWLDRAAGVGGELRVRLPDRELRGRYEALDEDGRLLLRLADGSLQTIAAGEIFPVPGRQAGRSFLDL